MPGGAAGFCVYNDASLAVARLLELGAERVAYVDVDVHHGDGVQAAFYDDPRVLTISLHEHPRTLFPQTGWPEETGGPAAEGSAVNIALPAGTGDEGWLRAFHAVVPELLEDFRPQVLVTQHGADTHFEDPLAHLAVSLDAQRAVQEACHRLAHEYADGRWLALGGGGYAVVDVVPRSWTHLVAIAAHRPVDPQTAVPASWRDEVYARTRQSAAGPDDGRADPAVAGMGRGLRPGGPYGSGRSGDAAGGLPAARPAGLIRAVPAPPRTPAGPDPVPDASLRQRWGCSPELMNRQVWWGSIGGC